jgi:hypothetical protein
MTWLWMYRSMRIEPKIHEQCASGHRQRGRDLDGREWDWCLREVLSPYPIHIVEITNVGEEMLGPNNVTKRSTGGFADCLGILQYAVRLRQSAPRSLFTDAVQLWPGPPHEHFRPGESGNRDERAAGVGVFEELFTDLGSRAGGLRSTS